MRFIKNLVLLLGLLFISAPAQNLLTNPGFEDGMTGWSDLWTRDAGTGTAVIVNSPVHGGSNALHITHNGSNDWSFANGGRFDVSPGQIYEFSAWVRVESVENDIQLCIVVYDADNTALDWAYAVRTLSQATGEYTNFIVRFVIPDGVATIMPRMMGNGACDLYADDLGLVHAGDISFGLQYALENDYLKADIQSVGFAMEILEKSGQKTYNLPAVNAFELQRVDTIQNGYVFHCSYLPGDFDMSVGIVLSGNTLVFTLTADPASPMSDNLSFPGPIASTAADYLVVPRATGLIIPVTDQYPFWAHTMWGWKGTMPFAGVTDLASGYMITSDDPWDTNIETPMPWNQEYSTLQLSHLPSKSTFGYMRTFYLTFFSQGGYVSMCKWYRAHAEALGHVKTFTQKIADNPNVEKLLGAVDFWALQSHFKTEAFIDSMVDFGMDRAILSLGGGWYNPADQSAIIEHINGRGLLSSRYDIYTDVWPPTHPEAPGYRTEGYPDDVIVNADGSLREGWLSYLNGDPFQGYYVCSATHRGYARSWIADDLQINPYNARFIDVELSSSLYECFSTTHPTGRREDAQYRIQLLETVKDEFNLVTGSEEARDWAFPVVDFGEGTMTISPATNAGYDWAEPLDDPGADYLAYNVNPAIRIPLHGLVYHDVHVPTWYTGDGASKVPASWDDKDLFNILYGSMPLFLPPNVGYWAQNREKFITSYHLVSSVFRITGQFPMIDHRMLSPDFQVQQSTFANGWTVVVNFATTDYTHNGTVIPSKGFYAASLGRHRIFRLAQGDLAWLTDRLFINPHGRTVNLNGVRTNGSVFFKRQDDHLSLAFIGSQDFMEFHPDSIPWPLSAPQVFTKDRSSQVQVEAQAGGWLRVNRLAGDLFYRIEGEFLPVGVDGGSRGHAGRQPLLFTRPSGKHLEVRYVLPESGPVNISILDLQGRTMQTILNVYREAGEHNLICPFEYFSDGVFILKLQYGGRDAAVRLLIGAGK
jgi:hypothetical protein